MDIDDDGRIDLLTGSYATEDMGPGHIFLFRGLRRGRFAPGELLLNQAGTPIELAVENSRCYATAPHLCDWDMDGDLDLLIGSKSGEVSLVINNGTTREYAFNTSEQLVEAGGRPIIVPGGLSGPRTADWDADGVEDLLVAAGDGSVIFFRNTGTDEVRTFAEGEFLIGPARWSLQVLERDEDPIPGKYARIHIVDWDGDGRLDLLKGDRVKYHRELDGHSPAEHDEFLEARRRYQAADRSYMRYLYQRDNDIYLGTASPAVSMKLTDELDQLMQQKNRTSSALLPYRDIRMTSTGYVWVYIRK